MNLSINRCIVIKFKKQTKKKKIKVFTTHKGDLSIIVISKFYNTLY